jgi:acetyltransferase-like isoleucine patch superfamily enzyme
MSSVGDAANIEPSADVDEGARVGPGVRIWHLAQVREDAEIGAETIIARGVYVGPGVRIGARCKLQNHALVYEPAVVGDGVFIGPAVVFTNDAHPRAVNPDGSLKRSEDWVKTGVIVHDGAAIGAGSVCVAPVEIGRWALVAAGAVVVHDVPDYGLVAGAPARRIGWVGPRAVPLEALGDDRYRCPVSGDTFVEADGVLSPE